MFTINKFYALEKHLTTFLGCLNCIIVTKECYQIGFESLKFFRY